MDIRYYRDSARTSAELMQKHMPEKIDVGGTPLYLDSCLRQIEEYIWELETILIRKGGEQPNVDSNAD
jgi:hypothetical protein